MMETVETTINQRLNQETGTVQRIQDSLQVGNELRNERSLTIAERELRLREDSAADRRMMQLTATSLVST